MKLGFVAALRASVRRDAADDVAARIAADREMLDHAFPCSHHTPLSLAASLGNLNTVGRLLELGAAASPAEDRPVTTPLHEAARHGHALVTIALLEAGAEPDLRDVSGFTPLDLAAANGHIDSIRSLLLEVPTQERRRHDGPCAMALFHAARAGCADTVTYLRRFGIPINAFAAIAMGDVNLVGPAATRNPDLLAIRHPNYRSMLADGAQPLHYAAAEGKRSEVIGLLRLGAEPGERTATGFNTFTVSAIADSIMGFNRESDREIAELVSTLAKRVANPELADKLLRAALHANSFGTGEFESCKEELRIAGCGSIDAATAVALEDPFLFSRCLRLEPPLESLVPALCVGCRLGVAGMVELLLARGVPADAELPGRPGATALRLAVTGTAGSSSKSPRASLVMRGGRKIDSEKFDVALNRDRIVGMLLSHGARDDLGVALTDAIRSRNDDAAITMLEHPEYPSGRQLDPNGQATATAILLSSFTVLGALLKRGADPNREIVELGGMRPLHVALAFHGARSENYVWRLLEHGAKPDLTDATYGAGSIGWAKYGFYPEKVPPEIQRRLSGI